MKKLLLICIIVLLCILTYYSIMQGIEIGQLKVLSVEKIKEHNTQLDTKIEETNKLIDIDYPSALGQLKTASNKLEQAKKEYLNLSSLSSEEDIIKATMEESYDIGLLWTKIGNYARSKGTNVEMAVNSNNSAGVSGLYNLNFTVNGSYVSIISFVEAIENDSLLNFRIKGFKLLPYQGSILTATFVVNNIAIEGNTSKANLGTQSGTVLEGTSGTPNAIQTKTTTNSANSASTLNNTNTSNAVSTSNGTNNADADVDGESLNESKTNRADSIR